MRTRTLVVADDETQMRLSLSCILESAGYRVLVAADGWEAFGLVERSWHAGRPADLLVTDVRMPDLDGMELARELEKAGLHLPVLFISGYGNTEMQAFLSRHPGAAYLDKPFRPAEMLTAVERLLRRADSSPSRDLSSSSSAISDAVAS